MAVAGREGLWRLEQVIVSLQSQWMGGRGVLEVAWGLTAPPDAGHPLLGVLLRKTPADNQSTNYF